MKDEIIREILQCRKFLHDILLPNRKKVLLAGVLAALFVFIIPEFTSNRGLPLPNDYIYMYEETMDSDTGESGVAPIYRTSILLISVNIIIHYVVSSVVVEVYER